MAQKNGAKFIQFDSVQTPDLNLDFYSELRKRHKEIVVLGGIGFKGTKETGNSLTTDLNEGRIRCEAIVTTGVGTGTETPLVKLRAYKERLQEFPLIVGAGVNNQNAHAQFAIVDGAVIGIYFKGDGVNTQLPISRERVQKLMYIAKKFE